jgi:hypothetical protein
VLVTKEDGIMMEDYTAHPAAAHFPLLEGKEFSELVADIKARGLDHAILVRGKVIIDGRNRLRACLEAGVAPRFEELDPALEEAAILDLILAANLFRRHLNASQRALIVNKMRPSYAAAAKERQREHGSTTHGKVTSRSTTGSDRDGYTDAQLAAVGKVSESTMARTKQIDQPGNEALVEAIGKGGMTVNKAYYETVRSAKAGSKPPADPAKHSVSSIAGRKCPLEFRGELMKKLSPIIRELKDQASDRSVVVLCWRQTSASIAGELQRMMDEWCG